MQKPTKTILSLSALALAAASASACEEDAGPRAEPGEELAGGDTTIFDTSQNAFTLPARNLDFDQRQHFAVGNSFFNKNWVTAPSSTAGRDGLGPTFNARSCSACHLFDGRGRPPMAADEPLLGLLFRLSVPGVGEHGGVVGDPSYGDQLQPYAIEGVPGEGSVAITYEEIAGAFADGEAYSLRRPSYAFVELAFGPMDPAIQVSPRVAPAMIGMGLLAAIPEAAIVAGADPDDADGDGISGRPNHVWDVATGAMRLGRLGWKANQPSVRQQVAGAFLGDVGITSSLFPGSNCPAPQVDCAGAPEGGAPELDEGLLDDVAFYSATLAVPARRDVDAPEVLRGKAIFGEIGCASCHVPRWQTGSDGGGIAELADQTIWPYTDLLLHDMGEALADGRPDFEADGREWRTPPLWGIGLVEVVNGHTNFLHDGRARDLKEAILWHDGEGAGARDGFVALGREDREDLLRFLGSL